MSKRGKSVVSGPLSVVNGKPAHCVCEACGRAVWEKEALARAVHFYVTVIEMFEKEQIKAFTLTAQDAEKLKLILAAPGPAKAGTPNP